MVTFQVNDDGPFLLRLGSIIFIANLDAILCASVGATSVQCSMWLVGYILSCTVLMKSLFICSINVLAEKNVVVIVREFYTQC